MKFFAILTLLSFSVEAQDLAKRPRPFAYTEGQAVFADFTHAHYEITYDYANKAATAVATIDLETAEEGHPLFDSHVAPTLISIDGSETTASLIATPNNETTLRAVTLSVPAGLHRLKIELPITQLVEFNSDGIKSAFWMSDLTERGYLERYLPTNLLFDRIPTSFHVRFIGSPAKQKIYTNGVMEEVSESEFKIRFPDGFNASCLYFHTIPKDSLAELSFIYKSVDGRNLPAVIYVPKTGNFESRLETLKTRTIEIMDELETDYGAFLHPSLTIYVNGQGGMEYSGATMTSESALAHELFHSYFARGVMPSDGNSGWIDEALARWRDNGYSTIFSLSGTSTMGDHGYYNRVTDRLAYTFGERFMALLDGKLQQKGGLLPFLRETVTHKSFDPLSNQDFMKGLNEFYGVSFEQEFQQYIFGKGRLKSNALRAESSASDDIHRQLSLEELQKLL